MFQWSPLSGKRVLPGNDNNVINRENEKLTFCRGWPVVAGWSFDFKLFFNPFSSVAEVNTSSPWWEMGNAKAGVREALFHSAHPAGWAESISGNGVWMYVCMYVCPSSLRRRSLFLLVGFTDPYNHTYSESLWWKLFKNHKRTQIQRQRPNICYIFEIFMTYSF